MGFGKDREVEAQMTDEEFEKKTRLLGYNITKDMYSYEITNTSGYQLARVSKQHNFQIQTNYDKFIKLSNEKKLELMSVILEYSASRKVEESVEETEV